MAENVFLNDRQKSLLETINRGDYVSIKDLADCTDVSEATIRRDLDVLSDGGFIERVHGGAIKLPSTSFERFHSEKIKIMMDEKQRIAKAAASLVKDGNSIFLDSGTTTLALAKELVNRKNLTVVTDNLNIAGSIEFDSSTSVILTGGLCRREYSTVVGSLTEETIKQCRVDIAFVACDAVNPESGLYNANYLEVGAKRSIIKCGTKTVLVSDHSKFGSSALAFVCPMSDIDCIITDSGLDENYAKSIAEQNIELILA